MTLSRKSITLIGVVLGLAAFGLYRIADANDTTPSGHLPGDATSTPSNTGVAKQSGTRDGTVRAEGRVATYPGAQVHLGTETGGRIARLTVQEQQFVKQGMVIAEVASEEQQAALAEAKARVVEADASIKFLIAEQARATRLSQSSSISKQGLDKANYDLESARASRAVAVAAVRRLEAMLQKMRITAPIDGTITGRYVEQGEIVGAGTRLVTIANLEKRRIEAEIDEYDLDRVHVGDSVNISAEGFESKQWAGTVEVVPDIVAQRRLEPTDPGRPLDTRVLLIKVTMPKESPLRLGQRVEIEIVPKARK